MQHIPSDANNLWWIHKKKSTREILIDMEITIKKLENKTKYTKRTFSGIVQEIAQDYDPLERKTSEVSLIIADLAA